MYTPYAGNAWILLLGKRELTIGKGSHQVCRRVLFLILVRCPFKDEGRGKKQNSYHQNTGFSAINTQVVRQTLCTNNVKNILNNTTWVHVLFIKKSWFIMIRNMKPPWKISVSQMTMDIVPLVVNTSRSFPHSWHITGFVTRLTHVPLVEQELLALPEHRSSEFLVGFVLLDL